MASFEECFRKVLKESCRSTFRLDRLKNRVEVPYGGSYRVGKDGKGIGIPKGYTALEDDTGRIHAIPPGHILKKGANGKGLPVCPSEPTSQKNGQIVVNRRKPKLESRNPSCLELLQMSKWMAEN